MNATQVVDFHLCTLHYELIITDAYYKEMTITYVITKKHLDITGESISLTTQEIHWRLILVVWRCCWLHGWTADTDTPIGIVVRMYVQKG